MASTAAASFDWTSIAAAWGRQPTALAAQLPVSAPRCFEAVCASSRFFLAGTRNQSIPDVRFYTTSGQLRAPGDLLPGASEGLTGYWSRVSEALPGRGWVLVVDAPFFVDFPIWATARDLLTGLWQRVGWPQLPTKTELAVAGDFPRTRGLALPSTEAGILLVLSGTAEIRLWRERELDGAQPDFERPDVTLTGDEGSVIYWPADYRVAELLGPGCLTLRFDITGAPQKAMAVVKNTLADLAQPQPAYADGVGEILPYPVPVADHGAVAAAIPGKDKEQMIRELCHSPRLRQTLHADWAARRSAAALEPPPPPLPESTLDFDDRIRAVSEIIETSIGPDRTIWAVNGHTFPVAGRVAAQIRQALPVGTETGVADLCTALAAKEHHDKLLGLLRILHRLRAIQLASGADPEVNSDG